MKMSSNNNEIVVASSRNTNIYEYDESYLYNKQPKSDLPVYEIMLMRNFEISPSNDSKALNSGEKNRESEEKVEISKLLCDSVAMEYCTEESERLTLQNCLGDLAPEAMNYIQRLESELSIAKKVPQTTSNHKG